MVLDVVRASPSPQPPFFFFFGLPCRPALTPRGHHHQSGNHVAAADKSAPVRQAEPATRPPPRLIHSHHFSARPTVAVDAAAPGKDPGRAAPPHRASPAPARRFGSRASHLASLCLSVSRRRQVISQSAPAWLAGTTSALFSCCSAAGAGSPRGRVSIRRRGGPPLASLNQQVASGVF